MKRVLKVTGLLFAGVLTVVILLVAFASLKVERQRAAHITVNPDTITLPTDEASLAEGKRILQTKGCAECHGTDMAGKTFVDEAPIGKFSGSNLTTGKGSAVAGYTEQDWVRAIRFGVDPKGRPLIFMPADDFNSMTNEELSRMVAYIKTLPPVDKESEPQHIGPVARVLYNLNQMPLLFPYERVDLNAKPVESIAPAETPEFGKHVAMGCTGCHGPGFGGGQIPGTPPSWPPARNLTPGGRFAQYSLEDFNKVLREGITPDGKQIQPQFMPWTATKAMTETEVKALYAFLKTVPAKEDGTR